LAWHWANGAVADPMAASDADVDAAWALALAAGRFGDREYRDASQRLATAVLERETVTVEGQPVLVAGPWAKTAPYTVNLGYLPAPAARALAGLTGDDTWRTLEATTGRLMDRVTDHGHQLPSDWAKVNPNGDVWPDTGPGGSSPSAAPAFGLEAARALLWNGAGCGQGWNDAVSATRPLLNGDPATARRDLDGRPASAQRDPVMLAATAVATSTTGDRDATHRLVGEAGALDRAHPTYFGGAWVGLAEAMYINHTLPACGTTKN
jgi:endoglucanase